MDLLEWVESRQWDQKMKDKTYFESFDEKPLQYLKKHDQKKYEEVTEIGKHKDRRTGRNGLRALRGVGLMLVN